MVFDDPVRDGEAQPRPVSDLLGREERVEDPLLQPFGNPRAGVGEGELHAVLVHRGADAEHLDGRAGQRIPGVGEDVHEHLLELDGAARDHGIGSTQVEVNGNIPQPQLLAEEIQRAQHHLVDRHLLVPDRRQAAEGAQVRDDLRGLAHLLHGGMQVGQYARLVQPAQLHEVDDVPQEQPDVVQRVVQLVGNAGGQFAERGQLAVLDQLLLFITQLLFAAGDFLRGLAQIIHDVDQRLTRVLQPEIGLVLILQDVQQGAAVVLAQAQALVQRLHLPAQALDLSPQLGVARLNGAGRRRPGRRSHLRGGHHGAPRSVRRRAISARCCSSSFSRAIIFSSRPTTTSSNFSSSKTFSCSSVRDFTRSRTTCSYSRISRRMPIAPITRPSRSRRLLALRVVGMTSPLALRGFRRTLRVTPRSTTSRRAATNSWVSWGEMNRDSDCSISSSGRNPSSSEQASLTWRILPSRSETNTGSGAFLIRLSAYARALSSSRMSRRMPIAPIALPSASRRALALRVVGMTSPVALRGFRRASRVTPRSTTSRRATTNSCVSLGEMNRDSDCSISSSGRNPSSSEQASLTWRILPSRSETNTGSGAFLIRLSAYARALSSSRMSRRMPIAPIALPSASRRALALRVVGMTSPVALRGFRRASRVTPRSTTSRRATKNSFVSWGEMNRDSDCSISSSGRNPSSSEQASLTWRILPSRSETNTGSGAFLIRLSAYARALSSSRMSRSTPMAPITLRSGSRRAEALSVVGMTCPLVLRGLRRALRVTPRDR